MFCLFGDTLCFMMFSSFSSAILLLHNQMRSICAILNEEIWNELDVLAGHVTRFKMAENICTIFSLPDLSTFEQRSDNINE